ncbi:MAG: Ig-like domain-containing protein [Gemmatimonadaceae bacterium]
MLHFRKNRLGACALALIMMTVAAACGDAGSSTEVAGRNIAAVRVMPESTTAIIGDTTKLSVEIVDRDGRPMQGEEVRWATSDSTIATVDQGGTVQVLASGSVEILASAREVSGKSRIRITRGPVINVVVSPSTAAVHVAQSTRLVATVIGRFGLTLIGREVTWSSSNAAVATVDGSGNVTGRAAGSAVIRATSEGKVGQATVTVTAAPVAEPVVASVTVNPASASIRVGETPLFSATVRDASGSVLTGRSISWSSTNAAVATISPTGVVTGIAVGTTTIRATSGGVTGSATLTVSAATLQSLVLTPASVTLASGATRQFSVSGVWSDGATTAPAVTYSATGGTISATGLYSAGQTAGTYRVIAVQQGGTRADTSVVTITAVTPAAVASVTVDPSSASVSSGSSRQFTATMRDAGGNVLPGRTVSWNSTNVSVATVSGSGMVTGVNAGTASIRATSEGISAAATVTVPSVTLPPPPATGAWLEEDFSTYSSITDFLGNPRKLYSSLAASSEGNEVFGRDRFTLEGTGYGSLTKSLRFNFPDRTSSAGRCQDYSVGVNLALPSPATEIWVEVVAQYSSNFTTRAPSTWNCTSNPDHKFLFGRVSSGGRFGLHSGTGGGQWTWGYPGNENNEFGWSASPFDGKWHTYRLHMKTGPVGTATFWYDGVLTKSFTNVSTAQQTIYGLAIGRNLNQGPATPQSLTIGRIRVWNTNPGF